MRWHEDGRRTALQQPPGSIGQQRWLRDASQEEKLCFHSKEAQLLWQLHFNWSDPSLKNTTPSCLDPSLPRGLAVRETL